MSFSILTSFDRGALAKLYHQGLSLQQMAESLGFSKSTIYYELQRYDPVLAQADADLKRKQCGGKTSLTSTLKQTIE